MSLISRSRRLRIHTLEDRLVPAFVTASSFPVAPATADNVHPAAVATADFNRDGKPDAATANKTDGTVSILLGNGNGTFKAAVRFPVGDEPVALKPLDVNGDGKIDLLTANKSANTVSVLIGRGDGTFKPAGHFAVGSKPVALAVGDFNADGRADVAAASSNAATVSVLLGAANGTLTAGPTVSVTNKAAGVAVGDFNGDGKPDLATVVGESGVGTDGVVDVTLNTTDNGVVSFGPKAGFLTEFVPESIVTGDFDNNGSLDLAVGHAFPSNNGVGLLLGLGDGTFGTMSTTPAAYQTPAAMTAADLNGDGNLDVVTANGGLGNNSVTVLLGTGAGEFGSTRSYVGGQTPNGVAVADFNRDGIPDVLTSDEDPPGPGRVGTVTLLTGNGNGTLRAHVNQALRGAGQVRHGDFDGDGDQDLAVAVSDPSFSGVAILPGLGNGAFESPVLSPAIHGASATAVADLDGDGNLDLAVLGQTVVQILLGNGDGTFTAGATYAPGSSAADVGLADFDGDGEWDLAVSNGAGVSLRFGDGDGDGTFGAATAVTVGGAVNALAAGDLTGDGKADLAVASGGGVDILINTGTGTFGAPTRFATRSGPNDVAIADLTGDGKPDVLATMVFDSDFDEGVMVLRNIGAGKFAFKATYPADSLPNGLAVADFTGDGRLDVAVANQFGNTVTILPNLGTGALGAPVRYVVGSTPRSVTAADFNGDGSPDVAANASNASSVTVLETPTAASSFRVNIVPATTKAGTSFLVTVAALDAGDRIADSFRGRVTFTSSDGKGLLPAAYTFTAVDRGVRAFTVNLKTAGTQTLTATATGVAATADSVVVTPATFARLRVTSSASSVVAGSPVDVTVAAVDDYGNVVPDYARSVRFTSTAGALAVLPPEYTFVPADNGSRTFPVTVKKAGAQTVTVFDPLKPLVKGIAKLAVSADVVSGFAITGLPTTLTLTRNAARLVTVTAVDQFGNRIRNYAGTIGFSIGGGTGTLPPAYTFKPLDAGRKVFSLKFLTIGGGQSLTVADQNDLLITTTVGGITVV